MAVATLNSPRQILKNYEWLRKQLEGTEVRLVIVTKGVPPSHIQPLVDVGHRDFGENRVQEWRSKYPALPDWIRWHHIGYLQTNKVRYLLPRIYWIHSVDRPDLMEVLDRRAHRLHIRVACLIEIKIAQEETKHGMSPEQFLQWLAQKGWRNYPRLQFLGLMGIATYTENRQQIRSEFRQLRALRDEAQRQAGNELPDFRELSMGMSHDWELAIEEGATTLRIGSLIFRENR